MKQVSDLISNSLTLINCVFVLEVLRNELSGSATSTSRDGVTTLVFLFASVTNGMSLPSILQAPAYFDVSRKLMAEGSGRF